MMKKALQTGMRDAVRALMIERIDFSRPNRRRMRKARSNLNIVMGTCSTETRPPWMSPSACHRGALHARSNLKIVMGTCWSLMKGAIRLTLTTKKSKIHHPSLMNSIIQ